MAKAAAQMNLSGTWYGATHTVLNPQLGIQATSDEVADIKDLMEVWSSMTSEYRPSYHGLTVTLSAPTLADQGTITAAQIALPRSKMNYWNDSVSNPGFGSTPLEPEAQREREKTKLPPRVATAQSVVMPSVEVVPCLGWDATHNLPESSTFTFEALQGTTGSYVAAAREGCYVPLKLDKKAMQFHCTNQRILPACLPDYLWDASAASITRTNFWEQGGTGSGKFTTHPYMPSAACFDIDYDGAPVMPLSSPNLAVAYLKGISAGATVTVTVRSGWEIVPTASSLYMPLAAKASAPDPVALKAYWRISQELLAAYPASYNFLGTLWEIIKQIGAAVLPSAMAALSGFVAKKFTPSNSLQRDVLSAPRPSIVSGPPRKPLPTPPKRR